MQKFNDPFERLAARLFTSSEKPAGYYWTIPGWTIPLGIVAFVAGALWYHGLL